MAPDTQDPQSIREMADAEAAKDEQAEMFPRGSIEGDSNLGPRDLFQPNHRIELTASLMSAEVPMTGGLVSPTAEGLLLVTYELQEPIPVPIREGDRGNKQLVGWKIRQKLRPIYVEGVKGEEGVILSKFTALLAADPDRAGALLDSLNNRASKALATA